MAVMVLVSASILTWFGFIQEGVYSAVVIADIGAYLTSNVVQKQVTKADPVK